jgi:hypothetical protein
MVDSRRIRLAGDVARMEGGGRRRKKTKKNAYRLLVGKPRERDH